MVIQNSQFSAHMVKKQKKPVSFKVAARAAATAKSKAKVPEPALPPRPSSKVIKACKLKPRGSVAYGSSSGSAMTSYGTPLCHHLGIHQNQQYVQDKDG